MAWSDAARAAALETRRQHARSNFSTAQTNERNLRYAIAKESAHRPKSRGVGGWGRMLNWQKKIGTMRVQHAAASRILTAAGNKLK